MSTAERDDFLSIKDYCTFSTGNFFISLATVLGIDFSLFSGLLFDQNNRQSLKQALL